MLPYLNIWVPINLRLTISVIFPISFRSLCEEISKYCAAYAKMSFLITK